MWICYVVLSSDSPFEESSPDFSEAVTREDDAMDLFAPTSVGLDLQEAICVLKFVTPLNFFLQSGQANKFKKKYYSRKNIFPFFISKN